MIPLSQLSQARAGPARHATGTGGAEAGTHAGCRDDPLSPRGRAARQKCCLAAGAALPNLTALLGFSSLALVMAALAFIGAVFQMIAAATSNSTGPTRGLSPQVTAQLDTVATMAEIGTALMLALIAAVAGTIGGIGHALRLHIRRHWNG